MPFVRCVGGTRARTRRTRMGAVGASERDRARVRTVRGRSLRLGRCVTRRIARAVDYTKQRATRSRQTVGFVDVWEG